MHAFFQKNFNNSGHINNDNSDKTQKNMQNTGHANYMLNNSPPLFYYLKFI